MKVDPLGQPRTAPVRRRNGGSDGSFARTLQESGRSTVGSGSGFAGVDALLALQEVSDTSDEGEGRRQAQQHGEGLLDRLDELRLALLEGRVPQSLLRRISQGLARRPQSGSNSKLEAVLDDIELRAAVELAKLERASAGH